MTKAIMIQGTSSDAGKSILVTALCRIFKQDGYKVAPFKAQNMALNAFVTEEGGEMGRAQVVQAEAAGIKPSVHMNPILLKPEADARSQIIVHGKAKKTISALDYHKHSLKLLKDVEKSYNLLKSNYDYIIIEGAGSPAEINLRDTEIANMRIAKMANAPVILVADIDRGGVFASMVGTLDLLDEDERRFFKGFVINKFRGDASLLDSGIETVEKRTGIPVLGIIPYFRNIAIAQEDSVYLDKRFNQLPSDELDIAIIRLPRISNYDDFDPLDGNGSNIRYVSQLAELGNPDLIIIPGSKSTLADLEFLRQSGLAEAITALNKNDTPVIGICGGYQIIGKSLRDPEGVESDKGSSILGLGLLDTVTTFVKDKSTTQVRGKVSASYGLLEGMAGMEIIGYEIHMGRTETRGSSKAFEILETPEGNADYPDGAINEKGTVFGTYIHGIFDNDSFRHSLINAVRRHRGFSEIKDATVFNKEKQYDKLAKLVRKSIDIERIYRIIEKGV